MATALRDDLQHDPQEAFDRALADWKDRSVAPPKPLSEAIGQRGFAIYEHDLSDCLETEENFGKMLVLDVETGECEVDFDNIAAYFRLKARVPNGAFYAVRLGTLSRLHTSAQA